MGFEPTIPASEWPQTRDFYRTATGIGHLHTYLLKLAGYLVAQSIGALVS
jgi:hypothetical protein